MTIPSALVDMKNSLSNLFTDEYILRRAFRDPHIVQDDRVLEEMLKFEESYLPLNYFHCYQREIRPWMREQVANWMFDVGQSLSINK
jgi:hypothetical protein